LLAEYLQRAAFEFDSRSPKQVCYIPKTCLNRIAHLPDAPSGEVHSAGKLSTTAHSIGTFGNDVFTAARGSESGGDRETADGQ
jgi:hypothetical protein